jgi:thiosulfate dehydrogenase [quinone] large subunit
MVMFLEFLRNNRFASYLFFAIRILVGWKLMTSGWRKITGEFDASGFLHGALKKTSGEHPAVQSWWGDFISGFAIPYVDLFNFLVPWGEFLVGIGLILGTFTIFAAFMGLIMNFSYLFSGTVSTNPNLIIGEFLILIGGINASKIGLDRWIIPYLKMQIQKRRDKNKRVLTETTQN